MKTLEVKKIFLGKYVSVRDYIVADLISKGEDLLITHGKEKMLIRHKNLTKGKRDAKQQFSKYNRQVYNLVDFEWKPTQEVVHKDQGEFQWKVD